LLVEYKGLAADKLEPFTALFIALDVAPQAVLASRLRLVLVMICSISWFRLCTLVGIWGVKLLFELKRG
jgi:hypothetical protein